MSEMNVSGNKRTASAQKTQSAKKVVQKKKKTIAQALHDFADNNTAAVGKQGFTDLLKKINKNTVISVIQNYDNLYNTGNESDSESIVETILDETGSKESATREALIGEGDGKTSVRGIFTILLDKAKEAGVDKNSIAKYKADFIKELNKELKGSRFMRSSAKMDEIIQVVIQSIENQKALTPKQKKYVAAAPSTMQATTINVLVNRYNKARKDFNAQLKHDGWAADVADGLSSIWGSKNTATKVRKDLKTAQAQIRELKEASKKGKAAFEAKFKEIFGISYNAQNVAAYEQFEKTYISASIQKGIEDKFKSDFKLLLNNNVLKEEGENRYNPGTDEYEYKTTATKQQVYTREFNKLAKYVKGGKEALNKKIAESGAKTLSDKYQVLKQIANGISSELHSLTAKACGGRSFSAVEKSYQNSYKAAFGLNNNILKRVTDYNISQEKGAGIVKGAVVAIATIAVGLTTGGSGLAGVAAIAGTAGAASAAAEVSDRATSGKAIDAAKKGGLKGLLKAVNEDVDWSQLAKTSLVNGAMAIAFMGTTYAVSGLTKVAASSLGMSATATAKATVATTTLAGVAFPVGTEYALTGKITVEGVAFAVVLAVVNGAVQLVKISQLAASAKAAQAETESMIQNARKTLGIPDDAELTPEVVKQYRNAKAKALHSDRSAINGASNDLEMALVNDAYKTLTNALKSGTVAAAKPTTPTTEPAAAQMAKDAALPAQIEGRTPAKQSSAETQIKSPEYQTLSDEITNCTNLDDLRKVIMPKMQKMTGQERIDIGFEYNKKFISLRDDLPQAVKDIENNFLRRIFNRDNSGNSNSNAEAIRHSDFINQHPKLFKDTYDSNNTVWRRHDAANMEYSPWKMHLYSVSESDWQKMCQVVIPILQKYDANWKTLGSKHTTEELNGSIQEGKAFTVYPKNNQEMEMIAKALDKAIREAGLVTEDSHIVGDRQMGNSGRLFYRYAYKSGQYKNYIIDLSDAGNRNRYNSLYDANRGEGQYLAKDMTPADDIWLNFDPSNTNSKPGAAPAPKGAIVNTPADAIQQSQKFNNSHNIGVSEVIMDGYKDGGRGLRFDKNGNPINQPTREIIVVDRTRDARLQSMIWEVKRKTHNMSDKEKAAFLQKYVFDICEGKNIQSKNMRAWVNRNVGKEVLLGDIIAEEPPIAVCRHRSLLLKILGDEIGLKVELQRGNFYNNIGGGGGHAWNVVRFNDGTSAIYDAMHNKTSNITPGHVDAYAQMYKTVNNEKLYTNQSRPINKPAVSTPRAQRHEFVSMKKPLLAERGLKEGQMLPQHQEVVMKLDDVVLLGGDYTLKLSEFSHLKDGQSITVGREGDYRIPGDNMHVSRNHLEITRRGNDLILVDNSKNGTRFVSWDIQENETAITETAFDDALDEPDKIIVDKPQNGDADKSAAKINANEGAVIDGSSIKGDFPKDTKVKCESGTVLLLGAEGQEFPLALEVLDLQEGQTYTVGRLGEIKIPGNYMSVSRQHLEITKQGDSFIVVDKSKYGTRIEVNSAEGAVIDGSSIKGDFPKDTKVKCESDVSLYLGAHEEGCILELNKLNLEEGRTYTVGRLGDIEIPGYYTSVSRLHLEITKQGNNFIVVDKSKYGTRIYN